jgi:Leucine-rich repeat (LRR) protein
MLRYLLVILCLYFGGAHVAMAQSDTLLQPTESENLSTASLKSKEITIDLSSPEEVDFALKKIHTFKYLESIVLQGETDDVTLKKMLYRLSVLTNLRNLTLSDNELTIIPDNISNLKMLKSITVEGNENLDYNDFFQKLKSIPINELNLADNKLKKCPASISQISTLQKIKLTGNEQINYEELINQLALLNNLTTLAIPVNYLTELPSNITKLNYLQVLDVSNNILTELPNEISGLKAINNLSIQGNLLLNPVKDLEKMKGNDIRFLSIDKEVSGEDVEKIKKMFPNVELSFPLNELEKDETEKIENKSSIDKTKTPDKKKISGQLKTKKELEILSNAYLAYPAIFRGVAYNFDTLSFEERYQDFRYANTYQNGRNRLFSSWAGSFSFSQTKPFAPIGKKRENWFHIPDYAIYPELRAFSGMYWIYQGNLSEKEFRKKFRKKRQKQFARRGRGSRKTIFAQPIRWNDIRIQYDKNNSLFTIEVKGDTCFEKFTAYPVVPGVTIEKIQQTYNRRFLLYQKALQKRTQTFKKDRIKDKRKYDASYNLLKTYAWKELQLRMSDEEKLMSEDEWLDYYDKIITNETKAIDNSPPTSSFLTRGLTLRNYNSNNNPINITPPIARRTNYGFMTVQANFIDDVGSGKLAIANIWIVDNQNKQATQYQGALGISNDAISIKQFASYSIIVELRNGNFGVVTSSEIDKLKIQNNQPCPLKVKVVDKNLSTVGELLKLASVN